LGKKEIVWFCLSKWYLLQ